MKEISIFSNIFILSFINFIKCDRRDCLGWLTKWMKCWNNSHCSVLHILIVCIEAKACTHTETYHIVDCSFCFLFGQNRPSVCMRRFFPVSDIACNFDNYNMFLYEIHYGFIFPARNEMKRKNDRPQCNINFILLLNYSLRERTK